MDRKEIFSTRTVTVEEAVQVIRNGDRVVFSQGAGIPQVVPEELLKRMPHKTLSTTGKTERAEKQRTEKKSRQTLSTFCLDFGWIQGDGIEGLQRAGWIEATQRAKNARKGA